MGMLAKPSTIAAPVSWVAKMPKFKYQEEIVV